MDDATLMNELKRLAREAGARIMAFYAGAVVAREKPDASPVTDADEAAERIIIAGLEALAPEIPIVAEERAAAGRIPDIHGRPFWLVDPLDGTKEFLSRNGEFTVNIALVREGRPVLGIVHAPAVGATYFTGGQEARPIAARRPPADGLVAVVSRSHLTPETEQYLAGFRIKAERAAGSSLKFCLIAAGEADIYPRIGRTMEWDTAAGHAVLAAAGGSVRTLDGDELRYGKPTLDNPPFVARGREA